MAYDDSFYYGQCRLVCTSAVSADNGKTVTVKGLGGATKSATMAGGKCEFMLPPRDKYTIELKSGNTVQYSTSFEAGYGECRVFEIGMNKNDPRGIKAIVNAGLESQFFTAGDQITVNEGSSTAVYDVLHVNHRNAKYGHNVVFGRHLLKETGLQSDDNRKGYANTPVDKRLALMYNDMPADWKAAITKISQNGGITNGEVTVPFEAHIWIPRMSDIVSTRSGNMSEAEWSDRSQFDYFKVASNRVKTYNGSAIRWWTSSGDHSYSSQWLNVTVSGDYNTAGYSNDYGVLPCFMIAADK